MSGRPIDADGTASRLAGDGVGCQAVAVVYVEDVDLFIGQDVGRRHEVRVEGDAAHVVEVGLGHAQPVDLAFEHSAKHPASFMSTIMLDDGSKNALPAEAE